MGIEIDRESFEAGDFAQFSERLVESLSVLREVLARPGFGAGDASLGAEVELSIVDEHALALPLNRTLLAASHDPQWALELDRFNLEYNLSPVAARGEPFSALGAQLESALSQMSALAAPLGGRVAAVGIVPTLRESDLLPSVMTELKRYRALSHRLRQLRQGPFRVDIHGRREALDYACEDVTLEGAATSFQLHVRVPPERFAALYNAAQIATAPALACGANSPTFLGRMLWDETRIALFKQALDNRTPGMSYRQPARVCFGYGWVRRSAAELFAESVALFPPLLPVVAKESPRAPLERGAIPALPELRLHTGTVWYWNRPVFDDAAGGHLRIELRALPAGPTPRDMVASAAFLLGLSLGLEPEIEELLPCFPFEYAEWNFYRAAQHGLDARLLWPTTPARSSREVALHELLPELFELAERGLETLGVEAAERRSLLGLVRDRVASGSTGARWQRRATERFETRGTRSAALRDMFQLYLERASTGTPVHEWSDAP